MKGTELEPIHQKAETILDGALAESANNEAINHLHFLLGGMNAIHAITTNLSAGLIATLQRIRDEKIYRAGGHPSFQHFLDNHPLSPMSYKKFNYLENIEKKVGSVLFDVLQESGFSLRQQKLIQEGDVVIDGERMTVRSKDESFVLEVDSRPGWTDALLALANANAANKAEAVRERKRRIEEEQKNQRGQRELEQLQRNIDRLQGSDPYERSFGKVIIAMLELTESIGQLPDNTKAARGRDALPVFWAALQRAKDAYGTSFSFEDHQPMTGSELDAIAAQVLSGDDD